jgi:hypothetical protein
VVPRDLFDYVSFANEPLSALTPVPPGRKAKDSKSKLKNKPGKGESKIVRGRGRPPSISEPPKFMLAAAGAGAVDQKLESSAVKKDENIAANKDQQGGQEDGERGGEGEDRDEASHREDEHNEHSDSDEDHHDHEQDEHDGHEQQHDADTSMDVEAQLSSSQNPQSQEHEAHNESGASQTQDGSSTTPAKPTVPLGPDVVLDGTHPMIGLWEGSFNVKVPTGTHVCWHTVVVTLSGDLQLLVGAPVPLYLLCVFFISNATIRKRLVRSRISVFAHSNHFEVDYCLNTAPFFARHRRRGGDGEVLLLCCAEHHLLHRRYCVAFVHSSVP